MVRVIGAGFGRTGTLSTKAALERLTGGTCYHMFEALSHLDQGTFPTGTSSAPARS